MVFRELLQQLVEKTGGAKAATLMGYDGIQVASHPKTMPDPDVQVLAVEFAKQLKEIQKFCKSMMEDELKLVCLKGAKHTILIQPLDEHYYLVLLLDETGNLGKGRYLLNHLRPEFVSQL